MKENVKKRNLDKSKPSASKGKRRSLKSVSN
jgi:hypothetical protein